MTLKQYSLQIKGSLEWGIAYLRELGKWEWLFDMEGNSWSSTELCNEFNPISSVETKIKKDQIDFNK